MVTGTPHYFFEQRGRNITNPWEALTPTELGMCLQLNEDGTLKQSHGGSKNGFTIDLNTDVKHYLPTTSTNGFILFIKDYNEVLLLNQGGQVIAPGAETFVKLTYKSIKRLGSPHGTCKNVESRYKTTPGRSETVLECQQRQEIDVMIKACQCIPVYFAQKMLQNNKSHILDEAVKTIQTILAAKGNNSKNYSLKHSMPLKRTSTNKSEDKVVEAPDWDKSNFLKTPYYKYACGLVLQAGCKVNVDSMISRHELELNACPEPCEYHEWDTVVTSTPFPPSKAYFEKFLKSDDIPTFELARENLARIHVYYDDIRVHRVEQMKSYQIYNFIAEFGGTVDLFIGFSFFTVFQLAEICIASCIYQCCKRKKVEK
jgi:hypothetical protein